MYRYDNYTDSFVRIDGEPNTGSTTVSIRAPLKEEAVIVEKVELTDDCINKIEDAVVRKLADRKTEPQADTHLQRLQMCADCEHNDMCEWCYSRWAKDEPQTEERTIQGTGDCEHCSRLFVDCDGR